MLCVKGTVTPAQGAQGTYAFDWLAVVIGVDPWIGITGKITRQPNKS